jgi:hypothetical protein
MTITVVEGITAVAATSGGGGGGGVSSVNISGGTTGLTASGGPITTSGTITLGGVLGLANGGTGVSLSDPAADRILFWDDSESKMAFLEVGSGLDLTGTTLTATGGGGGTITLTGFWYFIYCYFYY